MRVFASEVRREVITCIGSEGKDEHLYWESMHDTLTFNFPFTSLTIGILEEYDTSVVQVVVNAVRKSSSLF